MKKRILLNAIYVVLCAFLFFGLMFWVDGNTARTNKKLISESYHILTINEFKGKYKSPFLWIYASTEEGKPYLVRIPNNDCYKGFLNKMIKEKTPIYYPYNLFEMKTKYLFRKDNVFFKEFSKIDNLKQVFCEGKLPLHPEGIIDKKI